MRGPFPITLPPQFLLHLVFHRKVFQLLFQKNVRSCCLQLCYLFLSCLESTEHNVETCRGAANAISSSGRNLFAAVYAKLYEHLSLCSSGTYVNSKTIRLFTNSAALSGSWHFARRYGHWWDFTTNAAADCILVFAPKGQQQPKSQVKSFELSLQIIAVVLQLVICVQANLTEHEDIWLIGSRTPVTLNRTYWRLTDNGWMALQGTQAD